MSANCKFSNKYLPLVLRQHQNLSHDLNYIEGEFVDWMKNTFTDAEEILNKIKEGNGDWASLRRPAPTSILTKEKVPTFSRNIISTPEITPSVDQLYVGRADLRLSMEQRFAEDIVKLTVFNLDANDGQGQFVTFDAPGDNGISTGNQNILNYKNSLLKAMTDEMYGTNNNTVTLTADMSAQEFDGTINKVLQDYRMYISTHEDSGTAYTEFAIMQNFDNLLKARAPFISFNEDMDYDFADKYEYKGPSVQHYTGFTRDESASIAEQDSDLAKILLQVIPEVDDKGNIIQGSFIGLSGFNSAMLGLKKAILYSPASFSPDVRNSYFNGLNINMSKLIQEYINALLSKNNTLPAEHKTFLISKLRGIQKYIYDSRFEPIIKNMFTQMFFKTETVSYRAYSYDEDSRAVQARSLTSHFSDIQKLQLEDAIQGAAHLLRSNGTLKRKIKDKYRVQINNGVISLSDGGRNEAKIQVINKNNKLSYKRISGEDHFVSQIISDVLFMTVPDTYVPVARQIDGKSDITVLDDFATPLGIVLSNIFTNQGNSSSVLDLKQYNTQLSNIGRKLSVIYGSETKNVVRNLSGSKIPLYQLTNMTYNTMSILEDSKEWAKQHPEWEDIYKDQLFIRYPGLLVAPQVRNEIRIGDQIKPSSKLTVKELVNISALEDFYKPLLQDGIIYLQNATFADKSTHYLIGYNLNAVKNGDKTLRGSLKDVVDGKSSSPLIEFIRKERARRINAIANNVIADYNKATASYGFVWGENSGNVNFTSLEQIDDFLKNAQVYTDGKKPIPITEDVFKKGKLVPITEDILKEMFESVHIPLEEEVHYTKPKLKSRGKIRMNETFLNYHKTFNDPKLFEERVNKSRRQFIENIKDIKWNKFDSGRFSEIFDTYRQKLGSDWYDLNSGDIKLYNRDQLHPILEAYFLADILLSNEYNAVTIGEVWMHPNKNTNDTNVAGETFDSNREEGTYEEFSEANRLIAQIKRSVAFGATYHPFAQNQPNGVASEIDIAVISDMPAKVFTPNGEEDKVDSMDGSGVADTLQARFESNSLIDARVGDNKKTIMMDVDKKYGKPILLKWAVYALTNQYRRNGAGSFASAEELCRKMRSRQLMPGSGDRLVDLYNERVNSGKKTIFENNDTGERFRIESIEKQQDGTYRRRLVRINNNGTTEGDAFLDETVFSLNTLYSMDQILGGAWTGEFREDGKWIYNEANNDILEELLTRNNSLKSGFIAYAVNKSAIKVGSGNVNDESVFSDDNAVLKTIKMRTKYGGVQMDADHELDEAEVTEMTQMISSLIEDQHYPELVKEIYTDIGNVVERHMRKYVKELSVINDKSKSEEERTAAKDTLHQILGEALIAAFNTGTKDTLGLAQAFVQKASAAIAENKEFHIPFSSATINGQFISEVMASINRGGIRHKYEGLAGVLNPSFNMMQYYRVYNDETGKWEYRLYPQLAEYMRKRVGSGSVKAFQKNYEGLIDWNTENNPFVIDSINGRPITVNDVDFEDTVLVTELIPDEDGKLHYGNTTQHYINSYVEYDKVKTLLRNNPNYQIRLHTGKGRNLRGADTRFTIQINKSEGENINALSNGLIDGAEYSYYDLDSVKASFYLNRIVKNIEDKPLRAILDEDQINFLKTIYGETLETIDKATAQRYLKAQQTETQNILKSIETGKEFYLLGHLVTATSWHTRPPEIIMGRYQMNKLGIDDTVHQYQINNLSFFKENLNKKYILPSNSDINGELYDVILYDGNKKFFVKIGKRGDVASLYSNNKQVSEGNKNFTKNGKSVWYDNNEVMDSNGVRFYTYINKEGKQFNLISVDSIEEYNKLLNSGIFDDFQSYNYQENNVDTLRKIRFNGKDEDELWIEVENTNGRRKIIKAEVEITLENLIQDDIYRTIKYIDRKAKDMYEAYRNGRYFVGARIPTQAMQSFMPMECIAWADTDENIVYVPAMQTYLEGSDYDIDKLYILSFSIDDNGKLKTGSKLQNYFGLNVVSNVGAPTGIEYSEGENGTLVSETEVERLIGGDMDDLEVIALLKRIYSGGNVITFQKPTDQTKWGKKQYGWRKENFLEIVNSHSQSSNDVRGYNLKNRIVSAIYNITTKPQNQLIAQVPINMDEPKAAAANSKLGKAELHINSDNPATKFMMQVQNMVGKQVIGISAVALKGFFAMSYAYSQRVQDVKNAIVSHASSQEVAKAFQRLLLINPLDGDVTSVANIDIEQVIELLEDYPEYKQLTLDLRTDEINSVFTQFMEQCGDTYSLADESVTVDFERMLNVLQARVNRTDAALVISAIISAATDNAKELILAKINATPDLVDIYTYLTGIGVPFSEIADLMTSDALQFITQIGENNIFDSSTEKYKIKDTIGFYLGFDPVIFNNWQSLKKEAERERKAIRAGEIKEGQPHPYIDAWNKLNRQAGERLMSLSGIERNIIHCVFTKSKDGIGNPISNVELLAKLEDSNLIQSAIKELIFALNSSLSQEQQAYANEMHADADYRHINIIVFNEDWKKSDIRSAIKFLEMTLERNHFRSVNPNSVDQIKRLHKILPNVQVMSDFGNILGINQGLKTNLFEFWKMRNKFRELMSNTPDLGVVNPSEMLPTIPHFWQMLQTLSSAEDMIRQFSVKDRTILEIMDTLKNEDVDYKHRVSMSTDKQFRSIVNYVNDLLIAAFLNDANLSVHISHDSGYVKSSGEKVFPKEGFNMRLNSLESIDTFKKWMDEYVIPQLLERYKGNAFIEALRPLVKIDSKTRSVDTGWKPALQMMDIDASPNTLQMYGEMLRGFDEIAGNDATLYGMSIGDLLYLYNMILNKDGFGQNSFTRIFENLIQTSHGNLANKFNDYISRLDESDISLKWDSSEVKHRIKKDNPDIDYNDGLAASNSILDLPVFFREIVGSILTDQEWINKNKQEIPKIRYRYTLTSEDLVLALVKDFNDKAKDSTVKINLISDLDLEQYKELPQYESMMKSKGFIYNGDIYINLDRFHDKSMYGAFETAVHEIAHIILANWKLKNPRGYYDLISRVRNHEKFDQIAANYEGVIGSDLAEEVFVNLLEMYLSNKQYLPFDAENDSDTKRVTEGFASNIESGVIEMVSDLLDLGEDTKLKREDIISADLNTLFDKFGYNVLHTSIPVDKAVIMDKQKQDTIKRQLWNDEKLTNSCDEK